MFYKIINSTPEFESFILGWKRYTDAIPLELGWQEYSWQIGKNFHRTFVVYAPWVRVDFVSKNYKLSSSMWSIGPFNFLIGSNSWGYFWNKKLW